MSTIMTILVGAIVGVAFCEWTVWLDHKKGNCPYSETPFKCSATYLAFVVGAVAGGFGGWLTKNFFGL